MIDSWGSISQFAEQVGCSYEAARKMRDRNRISPRYWNIIIQLSKSKGPSWVTLNWFLHTYDNKSHDTSLLMTEQRQDTFNVMEGFTALDGSESITSTCTNTSYR
ncbi:hypothetical protein [Bartonella sp. CB178]|uniref:hypothetical protein n=1 Tax=Bartonella sp. CB178 TaxID=3112255 RepID=UPI00300DE4E7